MLTFRNINDAFNQLVRGIYLGDPQHPACRQNLTYTARAIECRRTSSRYGPVIRCSYPQLICYENPTERVLFNTARDFNPFLGVYEPLWMLAGRNDVAPLVTYAKKMADFSDDGVTFNAAYGERWRHYVTSFHDDTLGPDKIEIDQIDVLVNVLAEYPDTRRAVLTMWNVEDDLLRIGPPRKCTCGADRSGPSAEAHGFNCPAREPSRDVACNLDVIFQLRQEPRKVEPTRITRRDHDGKEVEIGYGTDTVYDNFVDIVVNNRSNDLVWGLAGNDYLVFSFLAEYVTARLNAKLGENGPIGNYRVGRYFQFTADLHAYTATFKPEEWLAWGESLDGQYFDNWYGNYRGELTPLVKDMATFDEELPRFVAKYATIESSLEDHGKFTEPFFRNVAAPMLDAFHTYRRGGAAVMSHVARIVPSDWRVTTFNWLNKRLTQRRQTANVPTAPPVTIDDYQREKEGGKTVIAYDSNAGGLPKKPESPVGTVENPYTHDPIADKLRNPELPLPLNSAGFEVDLTAAKGITRLEEVPPARPHDSHIWKDDRPNTTCLKCGAYKHLGSGFFPCPAKESK